MAERRRVPRAEYELEVRELRRLREEIEPKWRRLRAVVARVRFWESRIATLETRFVELRRIGWPRLRAPERREYREIRDRRLPEARVRHLLWGDERESIIIEIQRQRIPIIRLEEAIALKIVVVKEMIHWKYIILVKIVSPPPREYIKRLQAFYNIDALRDVETGQIDDTTPLTVKEIKIIKGYILAIFNWPALPRGAKMEEVPTSEWKVIAEPKGATYKGYDVREDEKVTTPFKPIEPPETVYTPTDKEKADMKKYVTSEKKTPKQIKEEEERGDEA